MSDQAIDDLRALLAEIGQGLCTSSYIVDRLRRIAVALPPDEARGLRALAKLIEEQT